MCGLHKVLKYFCPLYSAFSLNSSSILHDQVSFFSIVSLSVCPAIVGFVRCFSEGRMLPRSVQHGVRIVPPDRNITMEEDLFAVGKKVGQDKLCWASRMNTAVVVFLKDEPHDHHLI